MRRAIIILHRYLGIPLSLMFIVWLVSGIVMIYTGGMPSLPRDERLARLPAIEPSTVTLAPATALANAGLDTVFADFTLTTVQQRPVYRFSFNFGRVLSVFADSGEVIDGVSVEWAQQIAAEFADVEIADTHFRQTLIEPDQWTLTQQRDLPLHEFNVDDDSDTRLYVSTTTGDVILATNRVSRALAWAGAIPHWLYFMPLRQNQALWYWSVIALAGAGCVMALLGLALALLQFRPSRPFSLSNSVRYRSWMRWHYFSGAIFGFFALTWVFSGLLSMEPFAWTNANGISIPSNVLRNGSIDARAYPALATLDSVITTLPPESIKEITYTQILGQPYLKFQMPDWEVGGITANLPIDQLSSSASLPAQTKQSNLLLLNTNTGMWLTQYFSVATLVDAIELAISDVAIVSADLLEDYDSYYYSRDRSAPLPVLRLKFADPMQSWVYLDPALGQVVAQNHRLSRIERWLFNGLHSLDFAVWYARRPLWDIVMIALSLGALTTVAIGFYLGWKRFWAFFPRYGNR